MRTISQAGSSLLTAFAAATRTLHETVATYGKTSLRRKGVVNRVTDLNPHQMRDLSADLEGESLRNNPAFRAYEKERILNDARQRALLFTLGTGGR